MSRAKASLPPTYFDGLYSDDPDPWDFRTSGYERDKYAATLSALSRPRYASALEVGCSIGVFTKALKARCGRLLAIDVSDAALDQARRHCAGLEGIEFRRATVPAEFPTGRYDLIVLSEMLYYLSLDDLDAMTKRCLASLAPEGEVLLCHWLGETNYPLGGDEAADRFMAAAAHRLRIRLQRREPAYRLEVLGR